MSDEFESFNLAIVYESFSKSLQDHEEDVKLKDYLDSYEELNKYVYILE